MTFTLNTENPAVAALLRDLESLDLLHVETPPPPTAETGTAKEYTDSSTPHTDFLSGILASAGDITLEQIREERLARYMK